MADIKKSAGGVPVVRFDFGARTHIGGETLQVQEDGIMEYSFDEKNSVEMFAVLDGGGSTENLPHAEELIMYHMRTMMQYIYKNLGHDKFIKNIPNWLEISVNVCNNVIGGFKMKNDENKFMDFGASMTAAVLYGNTMYFVHSGNTRMYRLRNGKILQMTHDQTKAYDAVQKGFLGINDYYASPDRYALTGGIYGGLAMFDDDIFHPNLGRAVMRKDDIYCLTSDGIHFVVNENAIREIILESQSCDAAAGNLIEAARSLNTTDNVSAIVFRPLFYDSEDDVPSYETTVV